MGCVHSKTIEHEVSDPSVVELRNSKPGVLEEKVAADEAQPSSQISIVLNKTGSELASTAFVPAKAKTQDFALRFLPGEVCINEFGVVFYNFDGSNPLDPSQEIHVCKRYSEFKVMHAVIAKLMASEKNVKAKDQDKFQTYPALPSMPRANAVTFVLGRGDQNVLKEREDQFVKILNAIAAHPIAFKSDTFTEFLA